MKKRLRLLSWVLSLAMLCQVLPFSAFAEGGSGTEEKSTYHITDVDSLNYIRTDPSANYILDNDIDLSQSGNWEPIGVFTGSLDGNGHKISNLSMSVNSPDDDYSGYGFIYATIDGASIKNLTLENVTIQIASSGNQTSVGGLVGRAIHSTIDNCSVSGTIEVLASGSTLYLGGIVGYSESATISNCINRAFISALAEYDVYTLCCGGIVGYDPYGNRFIDCDNFGKVTGIGRSSIWVGGIAGRGGFAQRCRNYAPVYGQSNEDAYTVAGISGLGFAENCVNYGSVTGYSRVKFGGHAAGIAGADSGYALYSYNACSNISSTYGDNNETSTGYRIGASYNGNNSCYSLDTTLINGSTPTEYVSPEFRNGGSLSREELGEKIKEIFPNDDPFPSIDTNPDPDPTPDSNKEFTFKRDNLQFKNWKEYYFPESQYENLEKWSTAFSFENLGTNETTAQYFLNHVYDLSLCENIPWGHTISTEKLQQLLNGISFTAQKNIVFSRMRAWGGSCYGMSSVAAIRFMDPSRIPLDSTTYELAAPFNQSTNTRDTATTDLISYYQLMQSLPTIENLKRNEKNLLNTDFDNQLLSIIDTLRSGSPVMADIHSDKGNHTVLLLSVESEKEDRYIVKVYDPSLPKSKKMTIYKDPYVGKRDGADSTDQNYIKLDYKYSLLDGVSDFIDFPYLFGYSLSIDQWDLRNYYQLSDNEHETDYKDVILTVPKKSTVTFRRGDEYTTISNGVVISTNQDVIESSSIGVVTSDSDSTSTDHFEDAFVSYSIAASGVASDYTLEVAPAAEEDALVTVLVTAPGSSIYYSSDSASTITYDYSAKSVQLDTPGSGTAHLMYTEDTTSDSLPWNSIALDSDSASNLTIKRTDTEFKVSSDGLNGSTLCVGTASEDGADIQEKVLSTETDEVTVSKTEDGKLTLDGSDSTTTDPKPNPGDTDKNPTPSPTPTPTPKPGDSTTTGSSTTQSSGSASSGGDDGGAGGLLLVGAGAAAAITAGVVLSLPVEVQGRVEHADHTPLANAKVSILQNGNVVAQTTADENGAFTIKVKRGSYELTAAYTDENGQLIHQTIPLKVPVKDLTITF